LCIEEFVHNRPSVAGAHFLAALLARSLASSGLAGGLLGAREQLTLQLHSTAQHCTALQGTGPVDTSETVVVKVRK